MLSDSQVKSLTIEDGKRYADQDSLVLLWPFFISEMVAIFIGRKFSGAHILN